MERELARQDIEYRMDLNLRKSLINAGCLDYVIDKILEKPNEQSLFGVGNISKTRPVDFTYCVDETNFFILSVTLNGVDYPKQIEQYGNNI